MSKALIDDLYNGLNTSDGKKVKEMFQNKLCEELYEIDGDLNTATTGIKARVTTLENNKLDKGSYTGTAQDLKQEIDIKAPISSPNFTGNPTAPTPAFGDNGTSIVTSAFVQEAVGTVINVVGNNGGTPVVIPASKPIGYIYEIRKTGTTGVVNITLADTNEKFTTALLSSLSLNYEGDSYTVKKITSTLWIIKENTIKQTWQNVTSNRLNNTPYTNTTGLEIKVSVKGRVSSVAYSAFTIDGIEVAQSSVGTGTAGETFSFAIPNGSTYKFNFTVQYDGCYELR